MHRSMHRSMLRSMLRSCFAFGDQSLLKKGLDPKISIKPRKYFRGCGVSKKTFLQTSYPIPWLAAF